ncbi:MAG TPA: hypothetical protein VNU47_01515 [Candidatus Paceibacterota bacterium]|nr:hypothetical protein [Candidatus Paceibacterota bacterium]
MNPRIQTANYTRITRAYLAEVVEPAIQRLSVTHTPANHAYMVADLAIAITSFSPLMSEHFVRALAHLPKPATSDPDLIVYIWDSAGTGVKMAPPWSVPAHHSLETNAHRVSEDSFIGIYMHFDDTITLYDPVNKRAYFWMYDATHIPVWIRAAPFRTLFQWALGERDIHLVHGAVVSESDKAILLTAKGGSGKSTTALACLKVGMQYLADDYVAVSRGSEPHAYSLYNSVKVAPYQGNDFDPMHVTETEGEKSVVYLSSIFPQQMAYSSPLKAVMIPQIMNAEKTAILPATKAQAMLALIPTTLFQLPLAESNKVQLLSSIIAALPCYTVALGRDSIEAAQTIRGFIRENL